MAYFGDVSKTPHTGRLGSHTFGQVLYSWDGKLFQMLLRTLMFVPLAVARKRRDMNGAASARSGGTDSAKMKSRPLFP